MVSPDAVRSACLAALTAVYDLTGGAYAAGICGSVSEAAAAGDRSMVAVSLRTAGREAGTGYAEPVSMLHVRHRQLFGLGVFFLSCSFVKSLNQLIGA